MFFELDQLPGAAGLGVFYPALIVTLQSIVQIMGWSNVMGVVFETFKYVYEIRHRSKACRAGGREFPPQADRSRH